MRRSFRQIEGIVVAPNEISLLATLKAATSEGTTRIVTEMRRIREETDKTNASSAKAGKSMKTMGEDGIKSTSALRSNVRAVDATFAALAKSLILAEVAFKGIKLSFDLYSAGFETMKGNINGAREAIRQFADDAKAAISSLPGGSIALGAGAGTNNWLEGGWLSQALGANPTVRKWAKLRDGYFIGEGENRRYVPPEKEFFGGGARTTKAEEEAKLAQEIAKRSADQEAKLGSEGGTLIGKGLATAIGEQRVKIKQLEDDIANVDAIIDQPPFKVNGELTPIGKRLGQSRSGLTQQLNLEKNDQSNAFNDVDNGILAQNLRNAGKDVAAQRVELDKVMRDEQKAIELSGNGFRLELEKAILTASRTSKEIRLEAQQVADAAAKRGQEEVSANALAEQGSISVYEQQRRVNEAMREYQKEIDDTRERLTKLRDAQTDSDVRSNIQHQIDQLPKAINTLEASINRVGFGIKNGMQEPLSGFFSSLITGSKSAKQAFADMVAGFAQNLANLAAQRLASATLNAVFNSFGGTGGALSGLFTAAATAKAAGGWINGPNVNADIVPAMLTPGEYVVTRNAAGRSSRLLHAINSGHLTDSIMGGASSVAHYALGGPVMAGGNGNSGGGGNGGAQILPMTVVGEKEARTIISASENAIFELLNRHPERLPVNRR